MLRCWVLTSEVNPLITFRTSRCIKDSSGVVGGTEAHDSGDGVVKEGGGGGERERDWGGGGVTCSFAYTCAELLNLSKYRDIYH